MNSIVSLLPPAKMTSEEAAAFVPPTWMVEFVEFRRRLFLRTVEPIIVTLVGPVEEERNSTTALALHVDESHRRLNFLPN